jgi:hypothetical protein
MSERCESSAGRCTGVSRVTVYGDLVLVTWDHVYLLPIQCNQLLETTVPPSAIPGESTTRLEAVPNPARGKTTIRLALQAGDRAVLRIYDVSGRLVARPFEGLVGLGEHTVTWDGRSSDGTSLASGVYFLELEAEGVRTTSRAVLIR